MLITATPGRKVLHSLQGHSDFKGLILFLKPLRDAAFLEFMRIAFQIVAPKYLIEFLPFNSILSKDI